MFACSAISDDGDGEDTSPRYISLRPLFFASRIWPRTFEAARASAGVVLTGNGAGRRGASMPRARPRRAAVAIFRGQAGVFRRRIRAVVRSCGRGWAARGREVRNVVSGSFSLFCRWLIPLKFRHVRTCVKKVPAKTYSASTVIIPASPIIACPASSSLA